MEIRSRTSRHAQENTLRFDAAVYGQLVNEWARDRRGEPSKSLGYVRDRVVEERESFFGVEIIEGEGYDVAGPHADAGDVVEPSEQEKGDLIGEDVILAALDRAEISLSNVTPGGQPGAHGRLTAEAARLRGMLR